MGGFLSTYGSRVVQDHDLQGKVAIVTGPTSGIGYETCKMLASAGCHVILAGRGPDSRLVNVVERMSDELSKSHPHVKHPQFTPIELDLTSFKSIHSFVTKFQDMNLQCHFLFNNAGVMLNDYGRTVDGFEVQLGTNCIGHQYLTSLLMPILITSAPSRIINTSSEGHQLTNYNVEGGEQECKQKLFPKPEEYNRFKFYGHSKIGNIWFSQEITNRYASQGVISIACHPGIVSTELNRQTWYGRAFRAGLGWALKNSNQGAATQLWCALDMEWPKLIHDDKFPFYAKDCHIAQTSTPITHNHTFGKLWYDVNAGEIARVANSLQLPLGVGVTSTTASS